ncbi:MAG: hypothetical protein ACFFB0_09280 [Promethearchaeota archaeon]
MEERSDFIEEDKKRIFLIDNYPLGFPTDRISRIESIVNESLANVEIKTIHFSKLDLRDLEDSIGIILSGSSLNVSDFYYNDKLIKYFDQEIELIRSFNNIPILGICFGFHIIAYAFDGQVCRMRIPGLLGGRIIFILMKKTDDLITKKNIPVDVFHRDFISPNDSKIQNTFEINSITRIKRYKLIQYIRHRNKTVFGLQFHPETHEAYHFRSSIYDERIIAKMRETGEEILNNFVWLCLYKQNSKNLKKE